MSEHVYPEDRFQRIIEQASEAVIVVQQDVIRFCNPGTTAIIGYCVDELINKPFADLIHPDDRAEMIERYRQRLSGQNVPYMSEFRVIAGEGIIRWVQVHAALGEWDGRPATVNFLNDITVQKRLQAELTESEARYRQIVELAYDAIAIITEGQMVFANPATARLLKYPTVDELIGLDIFQIVHPDSEPFVRERIRKVLCGEAVNYPVENELRCRDGSWVPVEYSAAALNYYGRPSVQVIIRDVAEHRELLRQLSRSELRWRTLFENMRDGWVVTDTSGRILESNKAFREMTGCNDRELLQRSLFDLIHRNWRALAEEIFTRSVQDQRYSGIFNTEMICADGSILATETSIYTWPQTGESDPDIWVLMRNITDRRQAEEALRVSEELYRLTLSSISDAIIITDDDGMIIFASPSVEPLFGCRCAEVTALKKISDLFGSTIIDPAILMDSREIRNIEHEIVTADGQARTLLITVRAVHIGQGTILYICRDISDRKQTELSLQSSEHMFRRFAETIRDGLTIIENRRAVYFNERACEIFDYPREILGQKSSLEMAAPEEKERLLALKKQAEAGQLPSEIEFWIIRPDGARRCVRNCYSYDLEGTAPTRYYVVTSDITERKQAEEALRASEARYRNFFANAGEGIYWIDFLEPVPIDLPYDEFVQQIARNAVIGEVNAALAEMYGLTPEQMIGRLATDFAPDYGSRGAQVREADHYRVSGLETIDSDPNGEPVYLIESFSGFVEDGRLVRIGGVQRNVTADKKAARALQASEERFWLLVDMLPVPVAWSNDQGKIEYINFQFVRRFGYTLQDIPTVADWFRRAYPEEQYRSEMMAQWQADIDRDRNGESDFPVREYLVTCKNGTIKPVEIRATQIKGGILVSFNDLTEKVVKTRELDQKTREADRTHHLLASRETFILELKREINRLRGQLNLPPQYQLPDGD